MSIDDYAEKCDLSQYDCVIAWEENFTSYFLSHNVIAKKKIGYIHPDYQKAKFSVYVDEEAYSGLDYIACVSQATTQSLKQAIPSLAKKAICIPNTLVVDEILQKATENTQTFEKSNFDIVSVCRLDNVSKALDRAVCIAARLKGDGLNFKWYFVGDGPSKEMFEGYDNIEVCDDYLDKAGLGDYCFVEDGTLAGYHNKLEAVLLCNWNRSYPSDVKFTIDLLNGDWEKYSTEEFVGNSHDKITVEEWMKNARN